VKPGALLTDCREHLAHGLPEPERAVTDGQHRGGHATAAARPQEISPRLGGLPILEPAGYVRPSRDPLSTEDLATYRPARGAQLQRGEVLAGAIVPPDGRYMLTHTSAGGRCGVHPAISTAQAASECTDNAGHRAPRRRYYWRSG
jgi:hypothetical protein